MIFLMYTVFMCMCNGRKILHIFLYNPDVIDSGWITQSIHSTRKGAELAMEMHKAELLKEWQEKLNSEDQENCTFGNYQDWTICEFELLE